MFRKKWLRISFLIVLGLLILDIMAGILYYNTINDEFEKKEFAIELEKIDAAVVFFGGFGKNRPLNKESRRRLHKAILLFESRKVKNIICVGGARKHQGIFGAELMKEELIRSAVPESQIYTEKRSNDTYSNIREAFEIVEQNHWSSVVMISSPLHLYRIRHITSKNIPDVSVYYCSYSYKNCAPGIGVLTIWGQIHHEWFAFVLSALLPESYYRKVISLDRN